jgi:UDP-N-acetylmuramate: L-alanyl-gamma-D-glutamyl-meso-diaminopimelate ligase
MSSASSTLKDRLKKVHIVAVGGTLMGAFAAFLKRQGIEVTGSDQNIYPPMSDVLRDAGVQTFTSYNAENLTSMSPKPDLVVIGNVVSGNNPEARAAIDLKYNYSSLPEAMEKYMLVKTRNLVVSGTHGKTTTSSMLAHVLTQTGKQPNYFIGGVSLDLPFSFQVGNLDEGSLFVLEGDEYDTAFWDKVPKFNHYLPDDVILTSVEFDHADIYPDLPAVIRAFEGLMTRIRDGGRLIACLDYPVIKELMKKTQVPCITYGTDPRSGARFTPGKIHVDGGITHFEVLDQGSKVDELSIQVPGNHNVLNALAVWIECQQIGIDAGAFRAALKAFRGVKRRQEERGEIRGVLVIDDFAHHPTAVRETLRAFRKKYKGRALTAVFEPRSATSRRKVFQKDYADAFREADQIFIAAPYDQTKIKADDQFSSDQLVADLLISGKNAHVMKSVAEGVTQVAAAANKGDVIAVLSNGGFEGFIPKLLDALGKKQ